MDAFLCDLGVLCGFLAVACGTCDCGDALAMTKSNPCTSAFVCVHLRLDMREALFVKREAGGGEGGKKLGVFCACFHRTASILMESDRRV